MGKYLLSAFLIFLSVEVYAQRIGVRTSVSMLMTTTPNVEISTPFAKHFSMHFPVLYSPLKFGENSRLQQLTFMPGIRYWSAETYVGSFVSMYGLASQYNVGGILDMKYRYSGKCYGGGLGIGYAWIIKNRLNIEVEIGAALVKNNYDKVGWEVNSRRYKHFSRLHVIPAKADFSIVYFM